MWKRLYSEKVFIAKKNIWVSIFAIVCTQVRGDSVTAIPQTGEEQRIGCHGPGRPRTAGPSLRAGRGEESEVDRGHGAERYIPKQIM